MKRKLWIILALAAMMAVLLCTAANAESYDIYIAGRQVTSDQLSGLIDNTLAYSYDPAENVLHLQGSYTPPNGTYAVLTHSVPGLTIQLDSAVSLNAPNASDYNVLALLADTVITGDYGLYISGNDAAERVNAIYVNGALTVRNTSVSAFNTAYGLYGSYDSSLSLDGAELNVHSNDCAVANFTGGITLQNCGYERPFSAVVDYGTVYTAFGSGSAAAEWVKVTSATVYPLGIDG